MKKILLMVTFYIVAVNSSFDPKDHPNWKLLNHEICGQVNSERIIGGQEAAMNAYPWIARIGYVSSDFNETLYRCSGVIANEETIISAAHCVANLPKGQKVGMIRLGEHDIETNPDCTDGFCADPVIDITPGEIIIPVNTNFSNFKHDIAIIRLSQKIKFSAFVKPICFVHGNIYSKNLVGTTAEVAGWGIYDIDDPKSSIKLQYVKLPIVNNEECEKHLTKEISIDSSQLCVGGVIGKDSCGGDSGGPLMKVDDEDGVPKYYLLGLVSFGSKKCGKTVMPGVYTKLASHMKWVLDNLAKYNDFVKIQ